MNGIFRKILSLLIFLIALTVCVSAIPDASAAASYDTDRDGTLEILALGNSFSEDSMNMVYGIATDLGISKVCVAYLFYTGATLKDHVNYAKNKSANYTYYYCDNSTGGEWKSKSKQTFEYGMTAQTWDYIILQENSSRSGILSYYEDDLGTLIDYVKKTVTNSPKLVWNMTWAYQQNCENSAFDTNYGGDQMTMYNAILDTVRTAVVPNKDIDLIIPAATSVQNARTAWYGDTITRDGYHLSYGYGRYVAAMTVVKAITGLDVSACKARPNDTLNDFTHTLAVEAVNNAIKTPFAVTDSIYGKDDYVKITPQVTIGKYWSPTNSEGKHNELFSSNKYACFERFTAGEIPAGSIIWLESGWKYRPIGWNGTEKAANSIPWVTDAGYLITTDEFWNNYTTRSFNIVHPYYYSTYGTNQVLGDADIQSLQKNSIVVIYVPKSTHVHRLVDDVCTLCGYEKNAHVHDYVGSTTKSPTCTAEGVKTYKCACGDTYTEKIAAKGHTLTSVKAKAATCTTAGYEAYKYCTVCSYTTYKAIAALNHKNTLVTVKAKAATCTAVGYNAYEYCKACNYTTYKEIPATGHTKAKPVKVNVVAGTCTANGSYDEVVYCSVCKVELSRAGKTTEAKGHTVVVDKAVASTCKKTGLTEGKHCSVCNMVITAQKTVAKKAHTNKTTTTKATTAANGKIETKCTGCGTVSKSTAIYMPKTFTLSATSYTYDGKVKAPTVTVKDSKSKTLKKNTDYTVSYESGRKNPGEYTVTITLKGNYSGTKKVNFTIKPKTVTGLKATQTATSIKLTWSKVTGATGYRVYQYNTKTKKYDKLKDVKTNTLTISKLKSGTKYKHEVRAYTKDGSTIWGAYSKALETVTKPATPTLKVTSTKKGEAHLTWTNVSGESGYEVFYSTKKDSGFKSIGKTVSDHNYCFIRQLISGKTYYFRVRAYIKTANGTVYGDYKTVGVKIK